MDRMNTVVLVTLLVNIYLLQNSFTSIELENNVDELTENLIENLRADPNLVGDLILSEASKEFIDKHIENYMKLVLKTQENEFSRSKRSLPENETSLQDFYVDNESPEEFYSHQYIANHFEFEGVVRIYRS